MCKLIPCLLIIPFALAGMLNAQDTVDINVDVKHVVGNTESFDRSKYIIMHAGLTDNEWDSDAQRRDLLENYDAFLGRNNGSIIWEFNNTEEDPNRTGWPSLAGMQSRGNNAIQNYANAISAHAFESRDDNMMIGGQEIMFPNGQMTRPPGNRNIPAWAYADYEAVAEYYTNYLTYYFGQGGATGLPRPTIVEVLNEPFVKANSLGTTRLEITRMHNAVAKRIKQDHPNVRVGGYSAAYPAYEVSDFNHWRNNWKLFIDSAGENMDFFSFHLYDFVRDRDFPEIELQRRGSNIEAIMDMINHYSYLRLGELKPWSISEYGFLCQDCDGPYYVERDWYNLRSFNLMMLQLLERPDQIINAIPFMILKARWAHNTAVDEYNTYSSRLLREIGELPGEPPHAGWMYTHLIKYYQLWANVNGTRIDTKPTDLDLLSDAYVDSNKLYLILGNLNPFDRQVNLNFEGLAGIQVDSLLIKRCYGVNHRPMLDTLYHSNQISELTIPTEATVILEYTLSQALVIDEESREKTYFAESYLQPIQANQAISFSLNQVQKTPYGEAILRLGLGRQHGKSLHPEITVNGTPIAVPTDWRGYDQLTRDQFFGVLEIPVPYALLSATNSITVSFPDNGGHISSVALQVFNFSRDIPRSTFSITSTERPSPYVPTRSWIAYPNPGSQQIEIKGLSGKSTTYKMFNRLGTNISQGILQGENRAIDISTFPAGIYFLDLQEGENRQVLKVWKRDP